MFGYCGVFPVPHIAGIAFTDRVFVMAQPDKILSAPLQGGLGMEGVMVLWRVGMASVVLTTTECRWLTPSLG